MEPLTDRQKRFVREYLVDYNAARAAERAGYKASYAHNATTRLVPQPQIRAAIDAGEAERNRVLMLDTKRIIDELSHIAFANIRNIVYWGKNGLEVREQSTLPDEVLASVAEISCAGPNKNVRIRLFDKRAALDALARYAGLFDPDRTPQPSRFTEANYERARAALKARVEKILAERDEVRTPEPAKLAAPGMTGPRES